VRRWGGMCERSITAPTPEEMMDLGMKHLEQDHPEMAENIKKMPKDDPEMIAWGTKFAADWEVTPEDN